MEQTPYIQEFLIRYRLPRPVSRAYEMVCLSMNAEEAAYRSLWCVQTALRFVAALKQAARLALDPELLLHPPVERDLRREAPRATRGEGPAAGFLALLDGIDLLPLWQLLERAGIPVDEAVLDGSLALIEHAAASGRPETETWQALADRASLREALRCLLPLAEMRLGALEGSRLTILLGPRMEFVVSIESAARSRAPAGPPARPDGESGPPEGEPLLIDPATGACLSLAPIALWSKMRSSAFGRFFLLRRRDGPAGHYLEEGVPGSPGMGAPIAGRPRGGRLVAAESRADAASPAGRAAPAPIRASLAAPPARFADGELLDGHHRVLGLIWRGGTSDIFAAERVSDAQLVALKTFEYDATLIDENFWRFVNEERFSQRVSHPSVVAAARLPRGHWGLVHEQRLARRGSLSDLLLANGALRADRALEILDRLLEALQAVHAAGVLHNDVKPENVLFDDDGELRLIDFGVALEAIDERGALRPGAPAGTPGYIAPEVLAGKQPGERSDLYAAGVLLREMLGRPRPGSARARHGRDVRGTQAGDAQVDELQAFVATLAHPDPAARYPSAAAARAALAGLRGGVRSERAITLDLEGTLVPGFHRPEPRPGLAEFLAFCLERFDRIFVYTLLAAEEARELLRQVEARDALPEGFLERYEYVDWPRGADGSRKDLRRCGVPLEQNLIVDDMAVWIAEDQAHRWVRIRDCSTLQGVDQELARVRAGIERRLAAMA